MAALRLPVCVGDEGATSPLSRADLRSWSKRAHAPRPALRLETPTACAVETMPLYPVTVTASYIAARAPDDTTERLRAWAAAGDGRTFTVDDSIAPVRWTATVDYQIDADSEPVAERLAVERYSDEAEKAGITRAETVVAATGPLN
jgi:hypothetical protein